MYCLFIIVVFVPLNINNKQFDQFQFSFNTNLKLAYIYKRFKIIDKLSVALALVTIFIPLKKIISIHKFIFVIFLIF